MQRYELPHSMRYSLLEDREEFYRKKFDTEKVKRWLKRRSNKTVIAVIIGRHTGIFPPEYKDDSDTTILIDNYPDLNAVRNEITDFRPEPVYYDRNIYSKKGKKNWSRNSL